MVKKRRSNRKVHRGRRKKRGFSTWSLGKKIGVIAVSILLVLSLIHISYYNSNYAKQGALYILE